MLGALDGTVEGHRRGRRAGWFAASLAGAGLSRSLASRSRTSRCDARRERFPGLEFLLVSEGSLPFAAATFDGAWLGEVLEHVADVVGLLDEVARCSLRRAPRALDSRPRLETEARAGLSRRAFERHFERARTICVSSPPARSRACWRPAASSRSRSAQRAASCSLRRGRLDELKAESGGALGERPNVT